MKSSNPLDAPIIIQNFLTTEFDQKVFRSGMRIAQEVGSQSALQRFVAKQLSPAIRTDAALDEFIAQTGITVHHPLGTCKMGVAGDDLAVVDSDLKVLGAENLRVVDASAMPDLIGGNINAPVIMLAEKAADLIAGRWRSRSPQPELVRA